MFLNRSYIQTLETNQVTCISKKFIFNDAILLRTILSSFNSDWTYTFCATSQVLIPTEYGSLLFSQHVCQTCRLAVLFISGGSCCQMEHLLYVNWSYFRICLPFLFICEPLLLLALSYFGLKNMFGKKVKEVFA